MDEKTHPVIIIGGGPIGLTSSIALSRRRIPHLLFERRATTSTHPKAVAYNPRTVEFFRELGVEADILAQRAPPDTVGATAWYTEVGPGGREIWSRSAWSGHADEYAAASPAEYVVLPQIRAEPVLRARAEELNPGNVRFGVEVLDVVEDDGGSVTVTVQPRTTTTTKASSTSPPTPTTTAPEQQQQHPQKLKARYVLGADGGRFLADRLRIPWHGPRDVMNMVSVHFRAPLSRLHDTRFLITWLINPLRGGTIGTGYLYHLGPYPFATGGTTGKAEAGHGEEEWMFAFAAGPDEDVVDDPTGSAGETKLVERLRGSLGLPELRPEICSVSQWHVDAVVAERYRSQGGRVFLLGDAAHRVPPWGALGLNTGAQDVQNLVWKLDLALKEPDDDGRFDALLSTYEMERRPIAQRVARTSLHNLRAHGLAMDRALGIDAARDAAANVAAMEVFFDAAHPGHDGVRRAVADAQRVLDSEFHALGAEVGWFYPVGSEEGEGDKHDGALTEGDEGLDQLVYHPSTIPGHQCPHAWVCRRRRGGGGGGGDEEVVEEKTSTRDLVASDRFVLLARAGEWKRLEGRYVHVEVIGGADEDEDESAWADGDGTWAAQCGVGPSGAVLVRPDRIVAWRRGEWDAGLVDGWEGLVEGVLGITGYL